MIDRRFYVFILLGSMVACGGGGSSSGSGSRNTSTGSQPGQAVTVGVSGGQTTANIDITVPSGTSTINAQFIGTGDPVAGGTITLANTSTTIRRGDNRVVVIAGPGLTSDVQVQISGPQDISISNQRATTTQGNPPLPVLQFQAVVASNAALGARTVTLISGNNVTAFAGALEVLP